MKNSVKQTVLNLISNALFGTSKEIPAEATPSELDLPEMDEKEFWNAVMTECANQSCLAIVVEALPDPVNNTAYKTVYEKWVNLAGTVLMQNMRVAYAHEEIHSLMTEHQIPYVIIKGCASAAYYPSPYARAMGDVDFLVHLEDLERAGKVLESAGYYSASKIEEQHHHLVYSKDAIEVELHFGLNGVPEGKIGDETKEILSDLIEKAEPAKENGMLLPSDFHHGLVILLHNAHHMSSSGMGLRHLCDWAVFVHHVGDLFPAMYEKPLKEIGLWEYANIMTAVCTAAIGLPKQSWCKEFPQEMICALLDDIYQSGNMGCKRYDASTSWFVQNTNGQIENAGLIKRFLKNLTIITNTHWPIARKIVILYPIGWVFFTLRYAIRILLGKKKKIHIVDTLSTSTKRNQLYKKLHLFEKE